MTNLHEERSVYELIGVIRSIILLILTIVALFLIHVMLAEFGKKNKVAGRIFLREKLLMKAFGGLFLSMLFVFIANTLFMLSMHSPILGVVGRYIGDLAVIALVYFLYVVYRMVGK